MQALVITLSAPTYLRQRVLFETTDELARRGPPSQEKIARAFRHDPRAGAILDAIGAAYKHVRALVPQLSALRYLRQGGSSTYNDEVPC